MRFSPTLILYACCLSLILPACEHSGIYHVKTETVKIDSLQQIALLTTPFVKPVLYTNISGLEKLSGRQAKDVFISAILPSILVAKHEMDQRKKRVSFLLEQKSWSRDDSIFYHDLKARYNAKDIHDLIIRIGTLPSSIVLAQAAVESGWGTSRFFLKANNLFGVWSFNSNESRIMARQTREHKRIYLRSYPDVAQSIIDYFEILARSRSYKSLRIARLNTADVYELLPHLRNYSERRIRYTKQLKTIIVKNHLTVYDEYQIDPAYLMED